MIPSLSIGPPTLLNDCNHSATAIFWRSAIYVCFTILLTPKIPGTYVQYPGLQGGDALGDAKIQGKPAGSMAASTHGATCSHVTVAGGA